jgi:hypothetical protein
MSATLSDVVVRGHELELRWSDGRRLAGVYLNKEGVESRLRFLRVRAGEPV